MNLPSLTAELLSFFSFLAGGAGLSSPAAWAGVISGIAINGIENIASVNSLTTNLRMHLSGLPARRSYTEACRVEHPKHPNIPGRGLYSRRSRGDLRAGKGTGREHDEYVMQMNEA